MSPVRAWRAVALAAGLLGLVLLPACVRPQMQQQEAYVFGTRVEVLVADGDEAKARHAINTVLREFERLHREYHAWQPSELFSLNESLAKGQPRTVTPELAAFIREAAELAERGDHLFDPGIGRLIALWGFQADEFKAQLPDPAALAKLVAQKPSVADIRIEGNTVSSGNRAVALDFGGYLKGVALDRAAAILKQEGIHNALINIGGNVLALGNKHGRKWKVGIQHPRQPGPLAALELEDGEAIGTSGDYQRYFELEGKRYPHLIDPRSGWPASHTRALTIVIPAGAKAGTYSDALSKPLFIAGTDGWQAMARKLGVGMVLRVDAEGRIQVTRALRQRLETREALDTVE